jgi:SAM-dependent methyltransferase
MASRAQHQVGSESRETWSPYEEAMLAFHRGDQDAVVTVYDDFGRDDAPIAYFFRGPDQFPHYERLALEHCGGSVLDAGAGSGCHTLFLQDRGFQVTAIEALPGLVEIMRDRGVRDARLATWADLEAPPFDTMLVMMNGLGLAETLSGLPLFLREARRLVKPDGRILTDSTDVRVRMDPTNRGRIWRDDGRYVGDLHFQLEFRGRRGDPFPQLYVDCETLARYCRDEGWSCELLQPPDEHGHYLARLTQLHD